MASKGYSLFSCPTGDVRAAGPAVTTTNQQLATNSLIIHQLHSFVRVYNLTFPLH